MNAAANVLPITPPVPALPARSQPAHRIASDAEAIEVAHSLAGAFAAQAGERDRRRRLPLEEVERFSESGLWAITVPRAHGGAGVSTGTLVEVIAIIAAADGSLGQIPQNHFYIVEALRLDGTPEQQRLFFGRVLEGERFGNALSERSTTRQGRIETTVLPQGGGYVVQGRKFYSTGALFAHWIVATANDAEGRRNLAFMRRDAPGLTLVDDWRAFGQRTTASGSTIFDGVQVEAGHVVPHWRSFARPTPMGALAQIIHAAIDLGIARGAFEETLRFVRERARPAADSWSDNITDDPYIITAVGDLRVRLREAQASLHRAARLVDLAREEPGRGRSETASVAVAEAKILANDVCLLVTAKLFELGGARAVQEDQGLDRYWRDARTHTLHDPVRWKYHAVGNYWLNGVNPPRHGAL